MRAIRNLTLGLCGWLLLLSRIASGQIAAPGDRDPSGRVYAKVIVTITGEEGAFGHPVSGLRLLVVSEDGDRVSIRTSDAGVASTWVFPGSYRFVTPDPYPWDGNAYTWDAVVAIRPGTGLIRLSQANASRIVELSPTTARQVGVARPNQTTTQPGQIPFQYKDGTTATLLSLVITGGGQMYAGETGKGFSLLLIGVGAAVTGYVASNCDSYGCEDTGPLITGYAIAVGMWVYSLVDAHSAAARHNALAPQTLVTPRIEPLFTAGAERSTRVGVSLRF
jgi:TM2 domain-containing membrane protein YozV